MNDTIVIERQAEPNVIIELERLIKTHIDTIEKNKSELKKLREMSDSVLLNDETYRLHVGEAKDAVNRKNATKVQILAIKSNAELVEKLKALRADNKDLSGALSDYLGEYARMSGTNEIEDNSGKRWSIIKRYKISSGQQKLF